MNQLGPGDFEAFFGEVYGNGTDGKPLAPFPWQARLVERVCNGNWPRCIALPTAAGKTACIDAAVFALACQAQKPAIERTAPRRIFFVVDRRVVVDQAFEHSKMLAEKLANATVGVLSRVAAVLRSLAALPGDFGESAQPLDVYSLRGGMYRESAWVRSPLQPTVITSTVDQVGSRLLFRGYGVSDSLKPVHAALVGNDSLILLDEAHCSKPFGQTMALVGKYRCWAEESLSSPFQFVTMTATPAEPLPDSDVERDRDDDRAHPVLGARIRASKPAKLAVAQKAKGTNWRAELVKELASQATSLANEGFLAVGVIVNRVATARETAATLRSRLPDGTHVVLLTGRMRPMDRELVIKELDPLFSGRTGRLDRPVFVVATQCLEVGADLDFHALVSECASLDALRQRFGRLNRVFARDVAKAVVVVRADQVKPSETDEDADPIYGNALAGTWQWLNENKEDDADCEEPWIDFGIESIQKKWEGTSAADRMRLSAPAPDAAILLPAHLDFWCQTSPIPAVDPDTAVFLHGPARGVPNVQVIFRNDLGDDSKSWPEIVALCPPSSSEALQVPINVFKQWLGGEDGADESGDVEGELEPSEDVGTLSSREALCWKGVGSDETKVIAVSYNVKPNYTYVVRISEQEDYSLLGDFPLGGPTDQGDAAFLRNRDRAILRLTPPIYGQSCSFTDLSDDEDEQTIEDAVRATIEALPTGSAWDDRLRPAIEFFERTKNRYSLKPHPLGGFVLLGRRRLGQFVPAFIEPEESSDSAVDRPVPLVQHCCDVANLARWFAEQCGLQPQYANAEQSAGLLHDSGKADPRFQAWLHGGNRRKADLFPELLAKALLPMPMQVDRDAARRRAGYPRGARHELHSVRLAEQHGVLSQTSALSDLILHLIASHHGGCRPFAPIVNDATAEAFRYEHNGLALAFVPDGSSVSGHGLERLDSGVAERFWKLTRRHGWWGLAWLESLVRLADWAASDAAERKSSDGET